MSTNWESAEVLKTPMEISWQFDYAIGSDKLKNLYAKAKQRQWDAERDSTGAGRIDPSKPIIDERQLPFHRMPLFQKLSQTKRESFTAHVSAHLLSQFLHGEQGALMTAAALTHAVPDYEGKLYSATQTMDEARHVEVYDATSASSAIVYPISPWLKELIDATLTADHWAKIMIGMNMVVEGLALGAFHNMRRSTTCQLLRQLTEHGAARRVAPRRVRQRLSSARRSRDMHPDDREDVARLRLRGGEGDGRLAGRRRRRRAAQARSRLPPGARARRASSRATS